MNALKVLILDCHIVHGMHGFVCIDKTNFLMDKSLHLVHIPPGLHDALVVKYT